MRELVLTTRFRRDMRRMARRGKNPDRLKVVIDKLVANEPLEPGYLAHRLTGDLRFVWECHVENDWLLLWQEDDTTVTLIRTGTHSELFG